jgi:hypothetical protein
MKIFMPVALTFTPHRTLPDRIDPPCFFDNENKLAPPAPFVKSRGRTCLTTPKARR